MARKRHRFWNFLQLGLGGGSSRASTTWQKPMRLWAPSQNGLFSECPQRQREMTVRPASPKVAPLGSTISNSPSIRMGPLLRAVILVGILGSRSGVFDLHLTIPCYSFFGVAGEGCRA